MLFNRIHGQDITENQMEIIANIITGNNPDISEYDMKIAMNEASNILNNPN